MCRNSMNCASVIDLQHMLKEERVLFLSSRTGSAVGISAGCVVFFVFAVFRHQAWLVDPKVEPDRHQHSDWRFADTPWGELPPLNRRDRLIVKTRIK